VIDALGVTRASEPVWNPFDRAHIVRDVLAGAAVAARRRPDQPSTFIEQVDGQPVDLELTQIVVCRVATFGGRVALNPRRPVRQLAGAEDVVQAEHPLKVVYRSKVRGAKYRGKARTDLLGRAVGSSQLGVPVLEGIQLADHRR